jgi:hypothetical protein
MYKVNHENRQWAKDRIRLADLAAAGRPESQNDEARRRNLQARHQQLQVEIMKYPAGSHWRRVRGREMQEIQNELNKIFKPTRRDIANYFVDAARGRLDKRLFDLIMTDAKRLHDEKERA